MYAIGSLVLYSRRGVYKIESIGAPPLQNDDGLMYYKLCSVFSANHELIYVPVDTTVFMRPLISADAVSDSFVLASQLKPQTFSSKKTTDLIAHYRDMLASGTVEDCLLLIKEINAKQKELSGHNKKLGQVDMQYLKLAEKLVCEEFAAVLDTTPEQAKKRLYLAMRRKGAVLEKAAQ